MKKLAVLAVLITVSCSKFLDITVTNPCADDAKVVVGWWSERPSAAKAREALRDAQSVDNWVGARTESFLIKDELGGDLPFEGGWVIVRFRGTKNHDVYPLPPSTMEPVPVVVPQRLCPLQSM
jgi:hypothetical protein